MQLTMDYNLLTGVVLGPLGSGRSTGMKDMLWKRYEEHP